MHEHFKNVLNFEEKNTCMHMQYGTPEKKTNFTA